MTWTFHQLFRNNLLDVESNSKYNDGDAITTVQFNSTGDLLGIGDCGGRVSLLKRKSGTKKSHEPSFDFLKSEEIDEKINVLEFVSSFGSNHHLLVANDRSIHLWKIYEKEIFTAHNDSKGRLPSLYARPKPKESLMIPKLKSTGRTQSRGSIRTTYTNHAFPINSVSVASSREIFLSSDDLRINLHHLNHGNEPLNIVDIKPSSMESLNEVITSASFHPEKDYLLVYSSSKAKTNICDLRCSSSGINNHAITFRMEYDTQEKTVFSEIARSVSDTKIIANRDWIVCRDYLNILLWDIRMQREPLKIVPVHRSLESRLPELYHDDYIFDKFQVRLSPNGASTLTGSYGKRFVVADLDGNTHEEGIARSTASKRPKKKRKKSMNNLDLGDKSLQNKIMACSWHPFDNIIALSSVNNLYVMKEKKKSAL